MNFPRASGILLHPTSLPGRFGVGDLGDEAYRFADFLVASGQSLWQVLPLGPADEGGSPYSSYSAFAGNTLLISPEKLVEDGWLEKSDLVDVAVRETERVDFDQTRKAKNAFLGRAFERFQANNNALRESFASFDQEHASWLNDYALFQALKKANDGAGWIEWDRPLARREPEA
jgi:4-alpha-glucanotransferase